MEEERNSIVTWTARTVVGLTTASVACYAIGWTTLGMICTSTMFMLCSLFVLATVADGRHWLIPFVVGRLSDVYVPVKLIHRDGKLSYSVATKGLDGHMSCPVYWLSSVGRCFLLPNGQVSDRSPSSYIKWWTPVYRADAMLHQLVNDIPDPADLRKWDEKIKDRS